MQGDDNERNGSEDPEHLWGDRRPQYRDGAAFVAGEIGEGSDLLIPDMQSTARI